MKKSIVKILKLSHSGHGIAHDNNGNILYILGAYPDDVIEFEIYKKAEGKTYAQIISIVEASPYRTHTPSTHPFFNANVPWEHLSDEYEDSSKRELINKLFSKTTRFYLDSPLYSPELKTHYRNKAAYSFMHNKKGGLSFALYSRGHSKNIKTVQEENILLHENINKLAVQVLHFFNQQKVNIDSLKYLHMRYSYTSNTIVAHILVTETGRKKIPWKKADLERFLSQQDLLSGILVSHSEANIRSSFTSKDFYRLGEIDIKESVLGKTYNYHPSLFFQIYPAAFSEILKDCESLILSIENHKEYQLLDLFCGVGIIGIHVSSLVKEVLGVEQSPLAREYSIKNKEQNNISNASFLERSVESALEHIKSNQILVVDPPRSGMGKKLISTIQEQKPEYIIYISCNPETQAQDTSLIQDNYEITWSRAYNLFPKTSHVEHMIFLKRK